MYYNRYENIEHYENGLPYLKAYNLNYYIYIYQSIVHRIRGLY